jgi:hypothetical protein
MADGIPKMKFKSYRAIGSIVDNYMTTLAMTRALQEGFDGVFLKEVTTFSGSLLGIICLTRRAVSI